MYRCSRAQRLDGQRCRAPILAEPLAAFVQDAAVGLLGKLTVGARPARDAAAEVAERAIAGDEQSLREPDEMWKN